MEDKVEEVKELVEEQAEELVKEMADKEKTKSKGILSKVRNFFRGNNNLF